MSKSLETVLYYYLSLGLIWIDNKQSKQVAASTHATELVLDHSGFFWPSYHHLDMIKMF